MVSCSSPHRGIRGHLRSPTGCVTTLGGCDVRSVGPLWFQNPSRTNTGVGDGSFSPRGRFLSGPQLGRRNHWLRKGLSPHWGTRTPTTWTHPSQTGVGLKTHLVSPRILFSLGVTSEVTPLHPYSYVPTPTPQGTHGGTPRRVGDGPTTTDPCSVGVPFVSRSVPGILPDSSDRDFGSRTTDFDDVPLTPSSNGVRLPLVTGG